MSGHKSAAWALLLTLPAGFAAVAQVQGSINAERGAMYQEQDEVLIQAPKVMQLATLEYATLAADIYWTRAVQYYGNKRIGRDTNLESLWPLLDMATELDPNLLPAYRFGATFLSEPEPRGAGRPDLAVKLLERGIAANPEYWRLNQDLGNVYYLELKDHAKAGEAYLEGSRKPGAGKVSASGKSVRSGHISKVSDRGVIRPESRLQCDQPTSVPSPGKRNQP